MWIMLYLRGYFRRSLFTFSFFCRWVHQCRNLIINKKNCFQFLIWVKQETRSWNKRSNKVKLDRRQSKSHPTVIYFQNLIQKGSIWFTDLDDLLGQMTSKSVTFTLCFPVVLTGYTSTALIKHHYRTSRCIDGHRTCLNQPAHPSPHPHTTRFFYHWYSRWE